MAFIFLDESGQFNKLDHEQYFVVASFTVGKPRRTDKSFAGWRTSKFPRRIRYQSEIKFSDVDITDDLRLRTLRHIANLDVRIRYVYLLRDNIPDSYKSEKILQSGKLYTNVIGDLLDMYLPTSDRELRIFCDQRQLKGISRPQFKSILEARLRPHVTPQTIIQIEMIDSTSNRNIQIADWIVGALAAYIEKKPLGDEYFKILKNNLLDDGKELFTGKL